MKRSSRSSAAGLGIVVATALSGCGSLDANTGTSPTLATLEGSLTNPRSVALSAGSVRIAVVWRSDTPGQFNVAEDLPVQPVFPSSFRIAFDGPPPLAAMNNGAEFGKKAGSSQPTPTSPTGPNGAAATAKGADATRFRPFASPSNSNAEVDFAYGTVVAYLDKNENGKLDLVGVGADAYVDEIIAANQEMLVIYLQGTIPADAKDAFGRLPTEGYNLVNIPSCNVSLPQTPNPECATPPVEDAGTCIAMQWFGMSTPYALTVTTTPEVANLMCLSSDLSGSSSQGGSGAAPPASVQPAHYPSPCSPDLSCEPGGSEYWYTTCTTVSDGICRGTSETCTSVTYLRPSPTPTDWPCAH